MYRPDDVTRITRPGADNLVLDPDTLMMLYTTDEGRAIVREPLSFDTPAASPVTVARGLGKVTGLAYNSNVVYFLDYGRNSLMRISPGGRPEVLARDLENPRQLSYIPQDKLVIQPQRSSR